MRPCLLGAAVIAVSATAICVSVAESTPARLPGDLLGLGRTAACGARLALVAVVVAALSVVVRATRARLPVELSTSGLRYEAEPADDAPVRRLARIWRFLSCARARARCQEAATGVGGPRCSQPRRTLARASMSLGAESASRESEAVANTIPLSGADRVAGPAQVEWQAAAATTATEAVPNEEPALAHSSPRAGTSAPCSLGVCRKGGSVRCAGQGTSNEASRALGLPRAAGRPHRPPLRLPHGRPTERHSAEPVAFDA